MMLVILLQFGPNDPFFIAVILLQFGCTNDPFFVITVNVVRRIGMWL